MSTDVRPPHPVRRAVRRNVRALPLAAAATLALSSVAAAAGAPAPFGGASGTVAAVSGTSMEVQNPNTGQTTVAWTSKTTFSETLSVQKAAVTVGDCVTVTGTNSKKGSSRMAARSVAVQPASSSSTCIGQRIGTGGFPGRPAFSGGRPPGGFPQGTAVEGGGAFRRPPGAPGFENLTFASGKVTAVGPSSITIHGVTGGGFGFVRAGTKSGTKPAAPKPTTIPVTTTSSTTYSQTQTTASSALAVGDCVTAFGPTGSTGNVTAATVRITSPHGSSGCATRGFGGGGPGGPTFGTFGG
ncbi:MAG TPA: DUF5666 domain-containing protein [Acidimicrobiales bacterium]|nr:DUF5666 domain-containing protein [Acidimicrobiales bacterium]